MDKESVGCIHNGILLNYKTEWNSAICIKMDVSGGNEQNKPDRKTDTACSSLYMGAKF